jgi:hypothetical protein
VKADLRLFCIFDIASRDAGYAHHLLVDLPPDAAQIPDSLRVGGAAVERAPKEGVEWLMAEYGLSEEAITEEVGLAILRLLQDEQTD